MKTYKQEKNNLLDVIELELHMEKYKDYEKYLIRLFNSLIDPTLYKDHEHELMYLEKLIEIANFMLGSLEYREKLIQDLIKEKSDFFYYSIFRKELQDIRMSANLWKKGAKTRQDRIDELHKS